MKQRYQFRAEVNGDPTKAGRIEKAVALLDWTDKVYFVDDSSGGIHYLEIRTQPLGEESVNHYEDVLTLIEGIEGVDRM